MFVIKLPSESGVYAIVNKLNNKRLISFSKNMRHNAGLCFQHLLKNDGCCSKIIHEDWNLNSSEFTVELLEKTENKDRLYDYIRKYDSCNNGYNSKYKSDTYLYNHLNNQSGVYVIFNNTLNKKYIGFSTDIKRRVRDHFGLLRLQQHHIKMLQNDWNNGDNFSSDILEFTDNQLKEEFYIIEFKSHIKEFGYNTFIGTKQKI